MTYNLLILRFMNRIIQTGASINGIQFWPFEGVLVGLKFIKKPGVEIVYPDGVKRTIFNSRYDGQETDFGLGIREEEAKSTGRPSRTHKGWGRKI